MGAPSVSATVKRSEDFFGEQRTEHDHGETDGETGDEPRQAVDEDHLLCRHRDQCRRVQYRADGVGGLLLRQSLADLGLELRDL